jgi:hypothetical protein
LMSSTSRTANSRRAFFKIQFTPEKRQPLPRTSAVKISQRLHARGQSATATGYDYNTKRGPLPYLTQHPAGRRAGAPSPATLHPLTRHISPTPPRRGTRLLLLSKAHRLRTRTGRRPPPRRCRVACLPARPPRLCRSRRHRGPADCARAPPASAQPRSATQAGGAHQRRWAAHPAAAADAPWHPLGRAPAQARAVPRLPARARGFALSRPLSPPPSPTFFPSSSRLPGLAPRGTQLSKCHWHLVS